MKTFVRFPNLTCLALALLCLAAPPSNAEDRPRRPVVQLAILLDNSGSMSGLINQARTELWKVVNDFVRAKVGGVRPELQVAVYHYGDPPATQLVPLTNDLDRVSEALFAIPVSGGSEYCGQAIALATEQLQWSSASDDLKLIFIAGNEPFSQGPVDFRQACQAAIARGILINTIHCGAGIPDDWRDGALLADGKAMNIDHTQSVVHIEAPQDREITRLGGELNKTYLAYGSQGAEGVQRQIVQDQNAGQASADAAQARAVAKANAFYCNDMWDLCDAIRTKRVDLAKLPVEQLPESMRRMTLAEREAHVRDMQAKREAIQQQINRLNSDRQTYVAEKSKELAQQSTLDQALIGAIRLQATARQYTFE
ncbi:MAG: VWA domain-containing protein [Pirellulaceae bacterium]